MARPTEDQRPVIVSSRPIELTDYLDLTRYQPALRKKVRKLWRNLQHQGHWYKVRGSKPLRDHQDQGYLAFEVDHHFRMTAIQAKCLDDDEREQWEAWIIGECLCLEVMTHNDYTNAISSSDYRRRKPAIPVPRQAEPEVAEAAQPVAEAAQPVAEAEPRVVPAATPDAEPAETEEVNRLTIQELSEITGISKKTLYHWVARGKEQVDCVRVEPEAGDGPHAATIYVLDNDRLARRIDTWLERNGPKPEPEQAPEPEPEQAPEPEPEQVPNPLRQAYTHTRTVTDDKGFSSMTAIQGNPLLVQIGTLVAERDGLKELVAGINGSWKREVEEKRGRLEKQLADAEASIGHFRRQVAELEEKITALEEGRQAVANQLDALDYMHPFEKRLALVEEKLKVLKEKAYGSLNT